MRQRSHLEKPEPPKLGDGRHFLNRAPRQYDVVILDAFIGDSFPSHLMTRETFAAVKQVLRDLQDRIADMAREAEFPFIGPNCLGIYSPGKFDTFFLPGERLVRPNPGNVGFVSQSGGVLVDQMVKFTEQGLGLSLAVSIGNKALIRETDMLRHLADDPETKVICGYLESIGSGDAFVRIAEATASQKPVVIFKSGRTSSGVPLGSVL